MSENQALMSYYQRVILPFAFQYQSAGHFAEAFGCWQPVMHQMCAIKMLGQSVNPEVLMARDERQDLLKQNAWVLV